MIEVPIDALNGILAYLDTERRRHEDTDDNKRFSPVFEHATKVREWLSSLTKPGIVIVIRDADGKEISRFPKDQS
jgi:hypothetical protein